MNEFPRNYPPIYQEASTHPPKNTTHIYNQWTQVPPIQKCSPNIYTPTSWPQILTHPQSLLKIMSIYPQTNIYLPTNKFLTCLAISTHTPVAHKSPPTPTQRTSISRHEEGASILHNTINRYAHLHNLN